MTHRDIAEYVLLNDDSGTFETFDSEEDLVDFLKDEGFDDEDLESLRVFSTLVEYEVTPSYELEEVE